MAGVFIWTIYPFIGVIYGVTIRNMSHGVDMTDILFSNNYGYAAQIYDVSNGSAHLNNVVFNQSGTVTISSAG